MVKSMTGYGRGQIVQDGKEIIVEIKSVNHRYFDFSCRVPRQFGFLEERLKSAVGEFTARGKVDVYVTINLAESEGATVTLNHALLSAYQNVFNELRDTYGLKDDLSILGVCKIPDMCTVSKPEVDEDELWNDVKAALNLARESFVAMREAEGRRLSADILFKAQKIIDIVGEIEQRAPEVEKEYQQRLRDRMEQMLGSGVDENRIITEVAIFSEKAAIDEELVRLRSHFEQLKSMLGEGTETVGRKLDFLIQEMNREVNTTGSKSSDLTITRLVVDMKSELEKIREQIQNIE